MNASTQRVETLDLIRGLTLVSMILYHGMWDFVYLTETGAAMTGLRTWYEGTGGHLWQQSICRTFILLSGFCVPFSRHIIRRGLQVSASGCLVTIVTVLAVYKDRVLFGILTFLGAAMLLTGGAEKIFNRAEVGSPVRERSQAWAHAARRREERQTEAGPRPGAASLLLLFLCALLFYMTRWINRGYLRLWPGKQVGLPALLVHYDGGLTAAGRIRGLILTALGCPMKGFFSTDYFSLIPWIFLFWAGLFLHRALAGIRDSTGRPAGSGIFSRPFFHLQVPALNWLGRHSLLVYMLHQPVLYLLTAVLLG